MMLMLFFLCFVLSALRSAQCFMNDMVGVGVLFVFFAIAGFTGLIMYFRGE